MGPSSYSSMTDVYSLKILAINVGTNLRKQELTSLGSNKHIKVAAADATTDIMVVMDGL